MVIEAQFGRATLASLTVWEDASAGLVPNTKHRLRRGEKGQFDEGQGRTECTNPGWVCSFHPEALWLVLRSLSRESFNTHRFSFQKGHEKRLYNSDSEPHPAHPSKIDLTVDPCQARLRSLKNQTVTPPRVTVHEFTLEQSCSTEPLLSSPSHAPQSQFDIQRGVSQSVHDLATPHPCRDLRSMR